MVVLDSWAIVAFYHDHPCAPRVQVAIEKGYAIVSAINLGEVLYDLERDYGRRRALSLVADIRPHCRIDYPAWGGLVRAASIKARGGLSYADAFCVALAKHRGIPIWTGDPEIIGFDDPDVEVVDLR